MKCPRCGSPKIDEEGDLCPSCAPCDQRDLDEEEELERLAQTPGTDEYRRRLETPDERGVFQLRLNP